MAVRRSKAGASCRAFANFLLGNFGILALRPQVRRVADKVEQMRKRVLAVHDALDVEKDESFDSSRPFRLRNLPADPGSTDDVQHPPLRKSMKRSPARASTSRLPSVLKSRLPLKSGKQSSVGETTCTKPGSPP